MRISKTVGVTTTGVMAITITPSKTKIYKNDSINVVVSWVVDSLGGGTSDITVAFGDGTTPVMASNVSPPWTSPNHQYINSGTFTIAVSIIDKTYGVTNAKTVVVQVSNTLAASFSVDKSSGAIPLAVVFTFGITDGYTPYSWSLDFGDGTTPSTGTVASTTVSHSYVLVGSFTATLTITDALGTTALFTIGEISVGIGAWWNSLSTGEKIATAVAVALGTIGGIVGIKRLRKRR